MVKYILLLIFSVILLFTSSCASDISVRKSNRLAVLEYDKLSNLTASGLSAGTENLLANYLLMDEFEKDPDKVIHFFMGLFRKEHKAKYLHALADISLRCGRRYHSDADKAIRYYLPAAVFSYAFLSFLDDPVKQPYNADRIHSIHVYNAAVTELFIYLDSKKLYRRDGYSIDTGANMRITFEKPDYKLPLPVTSYRNFHPCINYSAENLTHTTRHFGLGVPLICDLENEKLHHKEVWAKDQAHPATLYIRFQPDRSYMDQKAQLVFCDAREYEEIKLVSRTIPLALDFSTPIAYMAKKPLPLHQFFYMLHPDDGGDLQGLYKFESFNEKRIPVVLVHGLMSSTRTWIQMFNTLQNDPDIRKHFQFWGYSYSSGIPVLFTAKELRGSLEKERERLVKEGKNVEMFDQMVLVGHSMGGLLCKTALMDTNEDFAKNILKGRGAELQKKLNKEQMDFLQSILKIKHLDFVKRVIFIAVPHRGSDFAKSFIGQLGSRLIRLPVNMISRFNSIVKSVLPGESAGKYPTGIDNLTPDSVALNELMKQPFRKGIPYHSIIGNNRKEGVPAGSDGIVPYSSSHLDGAASELVVRSGHSAQQNPLAIQEVRRILLEHLESVKKKNKNFPYKTEKNNSKRDKIPEKSVK